MKSINERVGGLEQFRAGCEVKLETMDKRLESMDKNSLWAMRYSFTTMVTIIIALVMIVLKNQGKVVAFAQNLWWR